MKVRFRTGEIEVDDEVWKICSEYGTYPTDFYEKDGEFILRTPLDKLKGKKEAKDKIAEAQIILLNTDWIVTKIAEAQVLAPETADALKEKYAEELQTRVNARAEINRLQDEYGL